MVHFAARPFGFIQCYDPSLDPSGSTPRQPYGTRGIDYFIGEPAMLGQGHGARFIKIFAEALLRDATVWSIIADPHPDNLASCRALARAGFKDAGPPHLPWGVMRLMVKEPRANDIKSESI